MSQGAPTPLQEAATPQTAIGETTLFLSPSKHACGMSNSVDRGLNKLLDGDLVMVDNLLCQTAQLDKI